MMRDNIKNGVFGLLLLVVTLPLLQHGLNIIDCGKLNGGFRPAEDTVFSVASWMTGRYQQQKEKFLNDCTGFRPDLVRLTNQIDYTLFDICHASWTVKGKNGHLFQRPYIDAYFGRDFIGYATIKANAIKLKAIQDTFAKMGKSLVMVYAASKASYYPEYFPDNWPAKTRGVTNYDVYRRCFDSLGIHQVDLDSWFVSMKEHTREPLFSKQGIHWTSYGAILAGDSLMNFIGALRKIAIHHPDWSEMEHTNRLRNGDNDIALELNLIFPVANETMAYPLIKELPDSLRPTLNAIYIGDSYAHKMVEFGVICKMNQQCEFWGYFDEMHDINGHNFAYIRDYNWKHAINKADCVVLVYTQFNLRELGNGFIDQTYNHFYPEYN